jgi:hypothetical protein
MRTSDRRMAFLCTEDETGRTTTKVADFGAMSLSIRTSGGYDTSDEQTRSITPDAAAAFWSTYSEILPLRGGDRDQVGGATWDAKFFDGEIIRVERGIIHPRDYVGMVPDSGSYYDILRLFNLLP